MEAIVDTKSETLDVVSDHQMSCPTRSVKVLTLPGKTHISIVPPLSVIPTLRRVKTPPHGI